MHCLLLFFSSGSAHVDVYTLLQNRKFVVFSNSLSAPPRQQLRTIFLATTTQGRAISGMRSMSMTAVDNGSSGEAVLKGPPMGRRDDEIVYDEGGDEKFQRYQGEVFCNRALNMRRVMAVGFDMDYTLAQYNPQSFELLAHRGAMDKLVNFMGYPEVCTHSPPRVRARSHTSTHTRACMHAHTLSLTHKQRTHTHKYTQTHTHTHIHTHIHTHTRIHAKQTNTHSLPPSLAVSHIISHMGNQEIKNFPDYDSNFPHHT